MHYRLGSATLSQLAFSGEGKPNFLWGKSPWDNTVAKKKKEKERNQQQQDFSFLHFDWSKTSFNEPLPAVYNAKDTMIFCDVSLGKMLKTKPTKLFPSFFSGNTTSKFLQLLLESATQS